MNLCQWLFAIAFLVSIAVSIAGVIVAVRAPRLTRKYLWILGSLFGFAGFSINWNRPDDLYMSFGFALPVVSLKWFASGDIVGQAMFPFIAAAAIWKVRDDALYQRFRRTQQSQDDE